MKMKAKNIVLSFLGSAALVSLSLGVGLSVESPVEAQAAEQTTIFECPGASIRMNKQDGLNGIRFPMFMDDTTFNTLTSNATIQSENVTFGTLIIPTDKLTGTLDVNTALAKNLVTYGYNEKDEFVNVWTDCTDKDYPDCMQGYAYIHSIPDTSLDRNLTAVGYYTVDGGANYVYTQPIERHVSYVADAAIKSGDYSEAQMLKLEDFLANYTLTFDVNSETTTQQVKYGKTFNFPTVTMETPAGSTLDWYEVDSGLKIATNGNLTATKSATYKLQAVENVQYTTTIYNKENIFKGDPSVTYKDGYYYSIHEDSKGRLWILKTTSLEEILEGGSSGWGHSGKPVCVYEPKEGDILGAEVWAPELTYIQGKWYIYVCGVAYGTVRGDGNNMKMFVLECESQDPTGTWKDPVRLYPKGFDDYYTIDGHAFEYKGQLYYVFSGQKEGSLGEDRRPLLYITKMSSPTECTNDTAVCISKGSDLEEGPCTIVDGDDVYLMYSAGTWNGGDYNNSNDYHLEYYKLSGTNLLSSNSWSEMGVCLEHDASKDIYAVGHNHIFKNADGSLWTSYHGIVGTADAGTDAYLAKRRCMVQPISIENGELNFGGIQDTVVITDKGGLQYNNAEKTEYLVDGYGSARLWKNYGKTFTVSTTIQRVSNEKDYCAGVTLYERHGDGNLSKLLIGVEEEGNIFFCKDYLRIPLYFKYADKTWQWGESTVANLTVTYTAGASTATSTITVEIANGNYSKSKTTTYTLDEINALVSDAIEGETAEFNLHFTGDFEIGLGGNRGTCTFTNVSFEFVVQSAEVENFACNIEPEKEGQFNNNAEASNINPHFEVEATFNGGDKNGLIGFAFTAEDGKVMRFAYDKVKGRFGFMAGESGWDHYREYALKTDVYNAEGANTIKVVYNGNRIFEVYMNGTKMVATDGRQGQFYLGWNCRDTAANSSLTDMKPYQMWGSSTIDSRATLTISAYASDEATVISGFSCEVTGGYVPEENPGDIVTSAEVSNFACNIEPEKEGQFNNNAEASNINPHFEVEATFNGGDENGLIGFAFTAEDGKVMRFAYDKVKGRFGFMAGESGWDHYREYALKTDVYNAEGANTIKVVYNGNRIFEVYMNGTKMVATDGRQGQFYLGWNCKGTAEDSSMTDMKPYQMWGSSTIDSRATLTISAYASDATTEITNFTCTVTGGYGYQG